jgi:hypothetical protein
MVNYTAYYDAGGSESDKGPNDPLVIVGLVGTVENWLEFAPQWDKVCERYGTDYLHMKEFAPSVGPYVSWKGKERKRAAFLKRLIKVIKPCVNKAFVYRLIPADFDAVNAKYVLDFSDRPYKPKSLHITPYPFAALSCSISVTAWMHSKHRTEPRLHVFERGDIGQGALVQFMEIDERIAIEPKVDKITNKWFPPFQACDLIAYEYRLAIRRRLTKDERPLRGAFEELKRMIPYQPIAIDQSGLFRMCRDHPEMFPRREA